MQKTIEGSIRSLKKIGERVAIGWKTVQNIVEKSMVTESLDFQNSMEFPRAIVY